MCTEVQSYEHVRGIAYLAHVRRDALEESAYLALADVARHSVSRLCALPCRYQRLGQLRSVLRVEARLVRGLQLLDSIGVTARTADEEAEALVRAVVPVDGK